MQPDERMRNFDSLGIIIPALNAECSLPSVLKSIKDVISEKNSVIIVDDGSTDATSAVGEKFGFTIVRHHKNIGKGAALRSGFAEALKNQCDPIITLDADGQHDPSFIPTFYSEMYNSGADIIVGNRMHSTTTMPVDRYLSNSISSFIVSLACGKRIPDSQCGYRLIKADVLKNITLTTDHFETETELLIKAARAKYKFSCVNINTTYNKASSAINRSTDTIRFIKLILKLLFN